MAPITVTETIDRDAESVFAYVTDPDRFHEWQKGVVAREATGTRQQVGERCTTTRRVGLTEQTVTSEITEVDRPRRWAIRGIDGPVRATVSVEVAALAKERSELTISVDFEGHGGPAARAGGGTPPSPRRDAGKRRSAQGAVGVRPGGFAGGLSPRG